MAQVVGGRYHLIAHLGGGASADVSLAKTDAAAPPSAGGITPPQLVVVKRLKLGADAEPEVAAQLLEEARLAVRLGHPNIAKAYEAGEGPDGPFLVLEYLEGQTLARIRSRANRRGSGVPRAIAIHIAMQVAAGLAYAHDLKDEASKPLRIVHRDVSPENIVVTYAGVTKLLDFSAPPPAGGKPNVVPPRGTVAYRAPEQVKSAVALDGRVDVFTTGIVLWELLAGRRMWQGLSDAEVLARLADEPPLPSLRSVVPDMPEKVDAVVAQALAKIRDDRFDSVGDLREALAKLAALPDLATTPAQVAELVTALFEDEREKMRGTVDEALVRPAGAGSLPQLRPLAPTSSNKFVDVDTDPSLWKNVAPSAPALPVTITRVVEVLRVEQAPSPDRRFALLVGGAVLIAFAGVAVVAFTRDNAPPPDTRPAVTASRPTVSAAADPAASALVEPEEVTIDITVRPLNAKVSIDGVRTPSNPHKVKVVRGKFVHEVRAEAEGFESRTMSVQFDRDRSFDIALVPKHPPGGPAPPPPPPPAPPPSAKRDAQ